MITGPQPAVEVIDILADAAAAAFTEHVSEALPADALTELEAFDGQPLTPERRTWRAVARAVRQADKSFQNPTPDAYSAALRAGEFHRERAQRLVELVSSMIGVLAREGWAQGRVVTLNEWDARLRSLAQDRVPPTSITCPTCSRTSYHPEDIRQRFCGACRQFHDQMEQS